MIFYVAGYRRRHNSENAITFPEVMKFNLVRLAGRALLVRAALAKMICN
tara:strand:+ start:145 stop:291 length:147 start_codon:yes stop_codon:yes gene_type:complete